MANPPRTVPVKQTGDRPFEGKHLIGRFLTLEAFVVALAAAQMPKDPEQRRAFAAEVRKDVARRTANIPHPELPSLSAAYTDTLIAQAVEAADT